MAALLLLVQLVGLNAAAWQARRQERALQGAIDATLVQSFPQIQVVVDAPAQMQRAVAALRQSSGSPALQDLDVMLQLFEQNKPSAPENTAPTAINFEAGTLRMEGLKLAPEHAETLTQALRSHALVLRQEAQQWLLSAQETP